MDSETEGASPEGPRAAALVVLASHPTPALSLRKLPALQRPGVGMLFVPLEGNTRSPTGTDTIQAGEPALLHARVWDHSCHRDPGQGSTSALLLTLGSYGPWLLGHTLSLVAGCLDTLSLVTGSGQV